MLICEITGPESAAGVHYATDSSYLPHQPASVSSAAQQCAEVNIATDIDRYITSDPSDSFMSWPDEPTVNTGTALDADSFLDGTAAAAAADTQFDSLFCSNNSNAGDYLNMPNSLDDLDTDFMDPGDNADSFF
jgi:hypothetical protein